MKQQALWCIWLCIGCVCASPYFTRGKQHHLNSLSGHGTVKHLALLDGKGLEVPQAFVQPQSLALHASSARRPVKREAGWFDDVKGSIQSGFDEVKKQLGDAKDAISEAAGEAKDQISNAASEGKDKISDLFDNVKDIGK